MDSIAFGVVEVTTTGSNSKLLIDNIRTFWPAVRADPLELVVYKLEGFFEARCESFGLRLW